MLDVVYIFNEVFATLNSVIFVRYLLHLPSFSLLLHKITLFLRFQFLVNFNEPHLFIIVTWNYYAGVTYLSSGEEGGEFSVRERLLVGFLWSEKTI